jgi:uncharacterized cupin superfamily protein
MGPIINRAEVPERDVADGDIAFARRRLAAAAGARRIGASLYVVAPGARQMPVHVHGAEEEIFYVLSGSGLSYESVSSHPEAHPVAAGDAIVHAPNGKPHSVLAGEDGLELLAFSSGAETHTSFLPRARVMSVGPRWVPTDGPHPFRAEALAGPLELPQVDPGAPRPGHIVALADVAAQARGDRTVRRLGAAAGSVAAGLNHVTLGANGRGVPHCHSLEEELFYVLDGTGTLVLDSIEHPLVAGDVVARPPSSGVCHHLTAGADGLTYLAYGTREPGDAVLLPERGIVRLKGLGVNVAVVEDERPPPAR